MTDVRLQHPASDSLAARFLRIALAAISGVLFALSFPDYSISWLIFVSFLPLLFAIATARRGWEGFWLGWLSQTVAWLVMVPWVVRVMSHYGGLPYATGVALFVAMCCYLGMYGGLFAALVRGIAPGTSIRRWLLVPFAWAAVEYLRTYLLTGFPWNLTAAALVDYTSLIQFDRVAGPYLIGAMVVFPAIVATWIIVTKPQGIRLILTAAGSVILLFLWWATGYVASKMIVRPTGDQPARAAMLQPNISQEMRWNESNMLDIYNRMISMTGDAIRGGASVVIWPESTVPLSFGSTAFYQAAIEAVSRQRGVDIILGSVAEDPAQRDRMWNAAFLVSGGRTVGHYDKIHLVPFGEYVPLRKMLFFASKLVRAVGEFEFGTKKSPLQGRFRYGPAICYEVVFPQLTRTQVRNGATVLVTITNDAWYDGTSAPRQHLNQARLRAIEDDRYLLRAGTTGISAIVDPTGTILNELPMGRQGIVFGDFQPRTTTTPYVRLGDWFAWVAAALTVVAIFRARRGTRIKNFE